MLNEINQASKSGMPFLAVAMTVALPDICASLEDPNGRTTGAQYRAWCEANLPEEKFSYVTPDDLWSMRCGVLHNGRFGGLKHSVARVIFVPPGPMTFANCIMNDAYVYGVVEFCEEFTKAVYHWMEANAENPTVKAKVERMMQYHPAGLAPYIVGVNVLA